MSISFDATSNSGYQTATPTYSFSHTCGAGNYRYLLIGIITLSSASQVLSVTYGSQDAVLYKTDTVGLVRCTLAYVIAPLAGAHNITVTLAAADDSITGAVSITGASQSAPAHSNTASATGTQSSVLVFTGATTLWTFSILGSNLVGSPIPNAAQTQRWNVSDVSGLGSAAGDAQVASSPVQQNLRWSGLGVGAKWATVGISLEPFTDGGGDNIISVGKESLGITSGIRLGNEEIGHKR